MAQSGGRLPILTRFSPFCHHHARALLQCSSTLHRIALPAPRLVKNYVSSGTRKRALGRWWHVMVSHIHGWVLSYVRSPDGGPTRLTRLPMGTQALDNNASMRLAGTSSCDGHRCKVEDTRQAVPPLDIATRAEVSGSMGTGSEVVHSGSQEWKVSSHAKFLSHEHMLRLGEYVFSATLESSGSINGSIGTCKERDAQYQ